MGEAERLAGFSARMISRCCANTKLKHKGYNWEYA
jgi:hypothetical protein